MSNILIVDPKEQSGALLKSILRGKNYGVSVSESFNEAVRKINTGLFDLVCIDSDRPGQEEKAFLADIKEIIPDLPVIAVSEKEEISLSGVELLAKPLSISDFAEAVYTLLKAPVKPETAIKHCEINLPVELKGINGIVPARTLTLSVNGVLVVPDFNQEAAIQKFQSFFAQKTDKIATTIKLKGDQFLKLQSRLTFADNTPGEKVKNAGLSFLKVSEANQKALEDLVSPAA